MSTFAAEIRPIEKVWKHPNAERLSLAKVEGVDCQFVILLDQFKVGELVVYLPVDSLLPEGLIAAIGLTGKLSGRAKNRVKTIRLRKEISQGICASFEQVFGKDKDDPTLVAGLDVTARLGIVKYEVPESGGPATHTRKGVRLRARPSEVHYYDIESAQRYSKVIEELLFDKPCYITEKLEGMNVAVLRKATGDLSICSRNCLVGTRGVSLWSRFKRHLQRFLPKKWRTIISQHEEAVVNSFWVNKIEQLAKLYPGRELIVRGEVLGPDVQDNLYKLTALKAVLFDIQVDGQYVSMDKFLALAKTCGFEVAPMLCAGQTLRQWLAGRDWATASTAPSVYGLDLREGIVIKPCEEFWHDSIGRVFFKMRSPDYLEKYGL